MSPVCAMTDSAATSAGATQAVTIRDEMAPITKAPMAVPRFWPLLNDASRLWIADGICRSYMPNMPAASTMNNPENNASTQGWLKVAWSWSPAAAAATPAAV